MKKLQFVVFHKDYEPFLEQLRQLGVVHVVTRQLEGESSAHMDEMLTQRERLTTVATALRQALPGKTAATATVLGLEAVLAQYDNIMQQRAALKSAHEQLTRDIEALAPWGEFSPEVLARLEEAGYAVRFFTCGVKAFDPSWCGSYGAIVLETKKSSVSFMTICRNDVQLDMPDATEAVFPRKSLAALTASLEDNVQAAAKSDDALQQLAVDGLTAIDDALAHLADNIDFNRVQYGTERAAAGSVAVLEGWSPCDNVEAVLAATSAQAYCQVGDPSPDDEIPIRLKNDVFSRMFEPIMKLYMMPKYSELDLTPFFAPFYMVFFGLCLGDTGYGLFILMAAIAARFAIKSADMRGYINLVITLGISAVLCGLLSGSFFGFNMYEDGWPLMDRAEQYLHVDNSSMFTLAIALGVVQILFGMILKVVNRWIQFGWQYAVGSIGWILILVGAGLMLMLPETPEPVIYSLVGVGAAGAALYNSPEKYSNPIVGVAVNVGLFLWDAYNTATGLLGDLLSYVRLFALGLSGGILATVFNSLAAGFAPDNAVLGPIVWVVIFLIGHGLNIFMSALGAMVHPLRLTFVEFFKNAGFEGGSMEYTPFKKN